jgi:hypothetical protein
LPERFNFPALVEIPNDQYIRLRLVEHISNIFSQWFCEVSDVFLLDREDPKLTTRFLNAESIENHFLSDSQILFLHFTGKRTDEKSVLSISKNAGVVVYTISLPNIDILNNSEKLTQLLVSLFSEISAMGLHCVVTGGSELEIEKPVQSVSDVIRSASQRVSLVEYLCCDRKDAAQLTNFAPLKESGNSSIFRRMHPR